MDVARIAEGLHEHTAAFAKAVAGADPETVVPTCPDWPLRVLVGHIGQAHRWAAGIVASGPAPVPDPFDAEPGEWSSWLREGADQLADAVLAAGDRPVWTYLGERKAAFWLRRMTHDTCVHYADAALATGTPFTVAPDLAADAISEWLAVLADPAARTIRPAFAELRGSGQTLSFRTDTEGWLVTRTPDGVEWTRGTGVADATLTGPVADLLLVLTRRRPPDLVTVAGDRALLDHWLAHTAA
jgi:uncharacterized protein (TIGR03083 family)